MRAAFKPNAALVIQKKMLKTKHALLAALMALAALGCEPGVPENTRPSDGSNPRVSGNPEDRIKIIEANPNLSAEEKARRISVVKERNHIQ